MDYSSADEKIYWGGYKLHTMNMVSVAVGGVEDGADYSSDNRLYWGCYKPWGVRSLAMWTLLWTTHQMTDFTGEAINRCA